MFWLISRPVLSGFGWFWTKTLTGFGWVWSLFYIVLDGFGPVLVGLGPVVAGFVWFWHLRWFSYVFLWFFQGTLCGLHRVHPMVFLLCFLLFSMAPLWCSEGTQTP